MGLIKSFWKIITKLGLIILAARIGVLYSTPSGLWVCLLVRGHSSMVKIVRHQGGGLTVGSLLNLDEEWGIVVFIIAWP